MYSLLHVVHLSWTSWYQRVLSWNV